MARLLNRTDILVRLRRVIRYLSERGENISDQYINGIIPSSCELTNFHITEAMVEALRCYEPPITEVLAVGTVDITGTNGSIWILVNGVPITAAAVNFVTSLTATATAIATEDVGYTVTSDTATLTITALAGSGVKPNGYVISSINTGDMGLANIVNLTGGVNGIVDADTCFTTTRVNNMFDYLKVLTGVGFAAAGATYINPVTIDNEMEFITTSDGERILTGTAASPGEGIGFNIRNQKLIE